MASYGLIIEGDADQRVFENLIRKINSPDAAIYSYPCGGVARLMREFPFYLSASSTFTRVDLDRALVIRDADNKPVAEVLAQMNEKLRNKTFWFPRGVELCCVNRKLDTWLLADEKAINAVIQSRGGKGVSRINETLEDIPYPKERLQKILSDAKLKYIPTILGEIASHIDLEQFENRAPSFKAFKESVLKIWGKSAEKPKFNRRFELG